MAEKKNKTDETETTAEAAPEEETVTAEGEQPKRSRAKKADEPVAEEAAAPEAAADETPAEPEAEAEAAAEEPAPEPEPEPEAEVAEAAEEPAAEAPAAEAEVAAAEPAEEPAAEPVAEEPAAKAEEAAEAPAPPEPKRKKKRLPRALRPQRTRPGRAKPAQRKPIVRLEKPEHERGRRQERRGVVVSDAMDKTIVVKVDTIKAHPKYKKVVRRSTKFHAHDEGNQAKVGDVVRIVETRPLSKTKRWRLAEVVEVAK
jgi:small subunit ribosomal protein S17